MIKYCKFIDEKKGLVQLGAGCSDDFYIKIGMEKRDVKQSDIDYKWYITQKCPMKTPEQKKKEELERIANLTCTKRVFALMLQEIGINYFSQLKPLIDSNPQSQLEWELCERLQRSNPWIDKIGAMLKITPEQLDILFQVANEEKTVEELKSTIV